MSTRKPHGFTLLELIVVIVILGVLAALALPTFDAVIDRSRRSTAEATAASITRDARALAGFDDRAADDSDYTTAAGEVSGASYDAGTNTLTVPTAGGTCDYEVTNLATGTLGAPSCTFAAAPPTTIPANVLTATNDGTSTLRWTFVVPDLTMDPGSVSATANVYPYNNGGDPAGSWNTPTNVPLSSTWTQATNTLEVEMTTPLPAHAPTGRWQLELDATDGVNGVYLTTTQAGDGSYTCNLYSGDPCSSYTATEAYVTGPLAADLAAPTITVSDLTTTATVGGTVTLTMHVTDDTGGLYGPILYGASGKIDSLELANGIGGATYCYANDEDRTTPTDVVITLECAIPSEGVWTPTGLAQLDYESDLFNPGARGWWTVNLGTVSITATS